MLPQTKKKGSKPTISSYLIAIGDSVKIEYSIEEEKSTYSYSLVLSSGDAFLVNGDVKGLSYGVAEVKEASAPKGLVLRDGALVMTVER